MVQHQAFERRRAPQSLSDDEWKHPNRVGVWGGRRSWPNKMDSRDRLVKCAGSMVVVCSICFLLSSCWFVYEQFTLGAHTWKKTLSCAFRLVSHLTGLYNCLGLTMDMLC